MEYRCKTPVLMIFFNRPGAFEKVFEKVRESKPYTLILAQDGARNEEDLIGIEACRQITSRIDWECKVIRDFSETNLGCGVRPCSAISNALKLFESVIILEDDCIPSASFFRYCDELLERYQNDDRVAYISGLNHFETWECGQSDYFFSRAGAIWGWATWRKKWQRYYDYYARGMEDPYVRRLYCQQVGNNSVCKLRIAALKKANLSLYSGERLSYWDTQWGFAEYTQNMLAIVPRVNLIHNIGVGLDSTHAQTVTTNKWIKYRNFVFIPIHELDFPLKHANFCACDMEYHQLVYKCTKRSVLKRTTRFIGSLLGSLRNIVRSITNFRQN